MWTNISRCENTKYTGISVQNMNLLQISIIDSMNISH